MYEKQFYNETSKQTIETIKKNTNKVHISEMLRITYYTRQNNQIKYIRYSAIDVCICVHFDTVKLFNRHF